MKKPHPLKGRKQSPEAIAKRKATYAAKREAKANGHDVTARRVGVGDSTDARDARVYLAHALAKWPVEKKPGISKLYVQLALATLEGKA